MESESRRKYLCLQAVDPETGSTCQVQISHARMQVVATRGMLQASECGYIVPHILQCPTAIFEGLRKDEDEDPGGVGWRCYCGIPQCAYHPDGSKRDPYPNKVFLVFVNDEQVGYNWRWERADPDDLELPEDHETRFKQRLL